MKKTNLILKMSMAALMASMYSTGASADVISGNANATVIAPLLLTETTAMSFGTVAGGTAAGTVTMSTAGVMGSTGGATTLASLPGTPGAFTIQGDPAQTYTLSITGIATLVSGLNSMTADTFTHNAPALLTGAADPFSVGGTLNVGASQPAGFYTTVGGTPFTLTANYN